jgi:hypothetical protein
MRQCPTPEGGPALRPLIAHRISACECLERQQERYHKCHRCVFQGKPVDFALRETNGVHRNGVVTPGERVVELPNRNGRPLTVETKTPLEPVEG